jgi:hypothetical protein
MKLSLMRACSNCLHYNKEEEGFTIAWRKEKRRADHWLDRRYAQAIGTN